MLYFCTWHSFQLAPTDRAGEFARTECLVAYHEWNYRATEAAVAPFLFGENEKQYASAILCYDPKRRRKHLSPTIFTGVPGIPEELMSQSFTVLLYRKSETLEDARRAVQKHNCYLHLLRFQWPTMGESLQQVVLVVSTFKQLFGSNESFTSAEYSTCAPCLFV